MHQYCHSEPTVAPMFITTDSMNYINHVVTCEPKNTTGICDESQRFLHFLCQMPQTLELVESDPLLNQHLLDNTVIDQGI